MLTCDAMVLGNREWDRRSFARPRQLTWRNKFDVVRHPRWLKQVMWPSGLPGMGNLEPYLPPSRRNPLGSMAFIGKQMDTLLDWDMLARLRDQWGERLLLKGVLHPADVERAVVLRLDGVVVSITAAASWTAPSAASMHWRPSRPRRKANSACCWMAGSGVAVTSSKRSRSGPMPCCWGAPPFTAWRWQVKTVLAGRWTY